MVSPNMFPNFILTISEITYEILLALVREQNGHVLLLECTHTPFWRFQYPSSHKLSIILSRCCTLVSDVPSLLTKQGFLGDRPLPSGPHQILSIVNSTQPGFLMDLPNILNNKGPAAAATRQLQHRFAETTHVNGGAMSNAGSERGMPHHVPNSSASFSSRSGPSTHGLNMTNAPHYTESPHLQQQFSIVPNPYPTPTGSIDSAYTQAQHGDEGLQNQSADQGDGSNQVKAFACSNCGKGFARRSDLARHGTNPCQLSLAQRARS